MVDRKSKHRQMHLSGCPTGGRQGVFWKSAKVIAYPQVTSNWQVISMEEWYRVEHKKAVNNEQPPTNESNGQQEIEVNYGVEKCL